MRFLKIGGLSKKKLEFLYEQQTWNETFPVILSFISSGANKLR